MHIAYFVTSHGFGHGVRTTAIANQFSSDVKITFRTLLPEQFFREELKREFSVVPANYDCGCLQSDGVTVNIEETLKTYKSISLSNRYALEKEVQWCRGQNVDLIVSDITPFAFQIAHRCNIPSVAVSNFTWYDIYSEYIQFFGDFKPFLDEILQQYSYADMLIALQPALEMKYFRKKIEAGVTGRIGKKRKDAIYSYYNLSEKKKLGLIYTGDFGMNSANWNRLSEFSDWEFLGLHQLPGNPTNFHVVDKVFFPYQDLTASADCVISKIGYGVISECFLNGTPLIYLPREHFVEYPVLEEAVKQWGMGYCLPEKAYYNLQWRDALDQIVKKKKQPPVMVSGAKYVAEIIESLY